MKWTYGHECKDSLCYFEVPDSQDWNLKVARLYQDSQTQVEWSLAGKHLELPLLPIFTNDKSGWRILSRLDFVLILCC